ncbi:hypothetical protein AHAS_Ahas03G0179800 [Arachis hypogaea]
MASQFNLLKDIDPSSENQVYKIKVRLIKSWSLIYSELKYQKPMIELVVMDEMGDHIQYTIRNPLRRLFEGDLSDSKNGTYVTYGTVVAIDYKSGWWYKSCKHCFHALKESENSIHCVTCDTFPNSHVPRFASIEIIGDDNTYSFSTPKRGLIEATSCTKSLIDVYPDFENQSSTKSRKITVEEVHNVVKLHEE